MIHVSGKNHPREKPFCHDALQPMNEPSALLSRNQFTVTVDIIGTVNYGSMFKSLSSLVINEWKYEPSWPSPGLLTHPHLLPLIATAHYRSLLAAHPLRLSLSRFLSPSTPLLSLFFSTSFSPSISLARFLQASPLLLSLLLNTHRVNTILQHLLHTAQPSIVATLRLPVTGASR